MKFDTSRRGLLGLLAKAPAAATAMTPVAAITQDVVPAAQLAAQAVAAKKAANVLATIAANQDDFGKLLQWANFVHAGPEMSFADALKSIDEKAGEGRFAHITFEWTDLLNGGPNTVSYDENDDLVASDFGKINLQDISEEILQEFAKSSRSFYYPIHKNEVGECVEIIQNLIEAGFKTLHDVAMGIEKRALEFAPEMFEYVLDLPDNESATSAASLLHHFTEVDQLAKYGLEKLATPLEPLKLEVKNRIQTYYSEKEAAKQAEEARRLASNREYAERSAKREQKRKANTFVKAIKSRQSDWYNYEIVVPKSLGRALTRVDFHKLRLSLCAPRNDSYRPADIQIVENDEERAIISTRDPLLRKHLRNCASSKKPPAFLPR